MKNNEKILSLYDKDIHVIVRGKAGAKLEFGNTLILDWKLYQDKVPADSKILRKSVSELQERIQEKDFCEHQKRRAQTEGRIGIIKNSFLGNPSKGKSFNSRNLSTAWSILTHSLWVLARLYLLKDC